jgi:hypothetical protein
MLQLKGLITKMSYPTHLLASIQASSTIKSGRDRESRLKLAKNFERVFDLRSDLQRYQTVTL